MMPFVCKSELKKKNGRLISCVIKYKQESITQSIPAGNIYIHY